VGLEAPFDALLVATHGRTGLSHVWLGSVAERIIRTSHKPLIVLRMPVHPA
jgi:nucleotide-binding universal stress UspA family protein